MTIKERWKHRLDHDRSVMRTLSPAKRAEYIVTYYKGWFIGLLVIALFAGYAADAVIQSHKEILIQGFFTNDEWNLFSAEDIEKEYTEKLGLSGRQCVIFDDDLYIDTGGGATEYTAASNGKLIAYMAEMQLDFTVTSEEVLHHYEAMTPMLDLRTMLPEELCGKLEPYLYVYTNPEGETKAIALEMTASRFIAGTWAESDSRVDDTYYLFVPLLAPHPESTVEFIRWCFPGLAD